MALKAGRVGLDPKYVTPEGAPVSNTEQIELEIEQLQTSKVGIGQLTANNKGFYFAYDATSQKYGYKLDGTGDFIPFEEGGIGWVPPFDIPERQYITMTSGVTKVSGGFYKKSNDHHCYIDIVVKLESGSVSGSFVAFTILSTYAPSSQTVYLLGNTAATAEEIADNYEAANYASIAYSSTNKGKVTYTKSGSIPLQYYHIWGEYIY